MFFATYLRQELARRKGRTILTALGLGLGVALVVAVTALGDGLDQAQKEVLGPLAGVATDLTVTRPADDMPQDEDGQRDPAQAAELLAENAGLGTDLSQLGEPGEKFSNDLFTASQLTFPDTDAQKVAANDDVSAVASALTLNVTHQEGTVPEIFAEIETGGDTIEQQPMTDEERAAFTKCIEDRAEVDRGPQVNQEPESGGGGGGEVRFGGPLEECLPDRLKGGAGIAVPRRLIREQVDNPSTDIKTNSFTVTGIEPDAEINVITANEVTDGRFITGADEAMVSETYAERNDLEVGETIKLGGQDLKVVGIVKPPLGGQTADVYMDLAQLQEVSKREGRSNVMLVRTDDASKVDSVSEQIENDVDGSQVSNAEDLAEQVSGSLVDSANLARSLGLVLAIVALVAAFALASLLTLGGVAKRVRELGTLKAIGWRPWLVVRQVLAESTVVGVIGGIVGVGLGLGAAAAIGAFAPQLHAENASNQAGQGPRGPFVFGLGGAGNQAASAASQIVSLNAPVKPWMVVLAVGLALVGGVLAGVIGSMRASRLRPADAMRDVG